MVKSATAARLLLAARRSGDRLDQLPPDCRPQTNEDAYAIHAELMAQLPLGGWKVGGGGNNTLPSFAPLYAESLFSTGAILPSANYPSRLTEVELGFRLLRPLTGQRDLTTGSVSEITELVPLIEIISSRFKDFRAVSGPEIVADSNCCGAMIIGEISSSPEAAAKAPNAMVKFDDFAVFELCIEGAAPLWRTTWLLNELGRRGYDLEKGAVIATGSLIAPAMVSRSAEVNSGRFGHVGMTFV